MRHRHLSLLASSVAMSAFANTAGKSGNNTTPPAAATTDAKADRVDPVLTGAFKIEPPAKTSRRGSTTKYPFDTLTEVGMAFGVKNKTAKALGSVISNANKRNSVVKRDENNNVVYKTKALKAADGSTTNVPDTSKPETIPTKHFYAVDVSAEYAKTLEGTPLVGSTVLVFRDK